MHTRRHDIPARVTLLAEHLTRAIDAGEALLSLSLTVTEPTPDIGPRMLRNREARLQRFLREARRLEVSLIAHILQARRLTRELGRTRSSLRLIIEPFLAGTRPLVDAASALADHDMRSFHEGDDALAYARSRALIAPDQAALMPVATLEVDDGFRIGGQVAVGLLNDLADAYLRALANEFGLSLAGEDVAVQEQATARSARGAQPATDAASAIATDRLDFATQLATARALLRAEGEIAPAATCATPHENLLVAVAPEAMPAASHRALSILAALEEVRGQIAPGE